MLTSDPEVAGDPPDTAPDPAGAGDGPGPGGRHRVARVVGSVGRFMVTSGVVILLLVAYQLWGTGLQTARAQDQLADEYAALEEQVDQAPDATAPPSTAAPDPGAPPTTAPPQVAAAVPPPALGEVVGSYTIPAIGLSTPQYTVQGTGTDQLKRGSAHYPGTPLPGQAGNAAVAGHRTTYGAPLKDVDDLVPGDQVFFTTPQGEFTYEVIGTEIVAPDDVSVLEDKGDDRLTLTACHPEFSAAERIIVSARLVGNPVPRLEGQDEAAEQALEEGGAGGGAEVIDAFATEPALTFPGAWWGLVCVALWGLTRLLAHLGRRSRRYPWILPYLVGTPVCLVVLYLFFESFSFEGFVRTIGLS
ncbi:class E sortase [Iamia majanohamensis]|uniref:Class E sortase n=1 Tax=Iamia majanohamensis TaxID=467976 RepID=A0AAF0BWP8_9ACTN|nr:class E sortase [Iamia majanohamensis]WCO67689.1 class E sortase [Iamia majanohamensis]